MVVADAFDADGKGLNLNVDEDTEKKVSGKADEEI
jgi:hypothetical protein